MYKNAIFDFDGTLLDSFNSIKRCLGYAFNKLGLTLPENKILRKFMGPSLYTSLTEILKLNEDVAQEIINLFRVEYAAGGMFAGELYVGIVELLTSLKEKGIVLSLATSKPDVFVKTVLQHYNIEGFFDFAKGADSDSNHSDKEEIIRSAILCSPAIMIGDRKYDIIGAKKAGVDCIGVTYGYCDEGEFEEFKPEFIADTLSEVYNIIVGKN